MIRMISITTAALAVHITKLSDSDDGNSDGGVCCIKFKCCHLFATLLPFSNLSCAILVLPLLETHLMNVNIRC